MNGDKITALNKKGDWLLEYKKDTTSQHGEDGIIEKIFEVIGANNKWCVELGALNGTHDSNVWSLIKNNNWGGVLIEADPTYFEKLREVYRDNKSVICINSFVLFEGDNSLDSILAKTPIPHSFDYFSLDIDGNDYHIWDSLTNHRPRVIIVEFNPSIPNDVIFIQPRDPEVFQGSSLRALVELGKRKGYELVAANETNAFFVLEKLFPKFGIVDNSIDALHTDHQYETKLFQLYDGTLMISGNDKLIWHKKKINQEALQVLPPYQRFYPAKISPNIMVRRLKYFIRKFPGYHLLQKVKSDLGSFIRS